MANQFGQFNLKPEIISALDAIHFTQPTAVQQKVMPSILSGRDVVGQSQTGSGKTHAFLIPICNQLKLDENRVQAVITSPSRELAEQIYQAAKDLADHLPEEAQPQIAHYVGGTDKQRQIKQLSHTTPQIVIGTPGRIKDLIGSQALPVHTADVLVIDEADMTLDMGFLNDVDYIASTMPKELQMLVFSATMPQRLEPFLKRYMTTPLIEEIPVSTVIADTIDNWLLSTKSKAKNDIIYQLLTRNEMYLTLVFTNTKERARDLSHFLTSQGLKVAEIHGDIPPRERKRTMARIKHLDFQYVVATDLAARGLDIEGVSEVINEGVPSDLEYFIHRVGRTGRNGLSGIAITLYGPDEEDQIEQLEALGIQFKPKQFKDGELVDVKDRKARVQRHATTKKLDPTMIGMVKRKKKQVKPGYKKQIKSAIKRKQQMDRRVEAREASRAKKRH